MRNKSKTLVVYVAGPFSAATREGVLSNIRHAEAAGLEVARLGAYPVIPHANTQHPDFESIQPYPFWIEGTLEHMRRCDAVVMVPGWEESNGARGEYAEAHRIGLPVFETIAPLAESIGHRSRPVSDTIPAPAPSEHEAGESGETAVEEVANG